MEVDKKPQGKLITGIMFLVLLLTGIHRIDAAGKEALIALREDGKEFEYVLSIIRHELAPDFSINEMIVNNQTSISQIHSAINKQKPKLVILIDNKAINLYSSYQNSLSDTLKPLPSISLMGVLVEDAISGLKNSAGISYEIPAVTGILSFQSVIKGKIRTTGVIHREFLGDFINRNKEICRKKGIDLQSIILPNKCKNYRPLIKNAIEELVETQGFKCLWMANDNVLLQPELIKDTWLPLITRFKIPVIVGVEALVKPDLSFGSFAVLPDHAALGRQAASMIYDIQKNNWLVKDAQVEPPVAVYKIVNYEKVKKEFGIREESLKSIDRVLK